MNGILRCPICGYDQKPVAVPEHCPRCGIPLCYEQTLARVGKGELPGRGVWRYQPLLPAVEPTTLGEGGTPLIPSLRIGPRLGIKLWLKLEGGNPTGSFKDRGATVLVSVLRSLGVKRVADDSSGNAGAALAAYAARAGLEATVFVPASLSDKKLAQIQAYGAKVVRVPGPREQATEELFRVVQDDQSLAYASHNESPYFLTGLKTLAYEIAEEKNFVVPNHIVVPLGGGGLFLGLFQGFSELKDMGWIGRLPKIHVAQAAACAPIAQAFALGLKEPAMIVPGETIAEGVRIAKPPRGQEILAARLPLAGAAVAQGDAAILTAQGELAREEGIFVEPTSALAIAALSELVAQRIIHRGEEVVVPLTGSGLKTPSWAKGPS